VMALCLIAAALALDYVTPFVSLADYIFVLQVRTSKPGSISFSTYWESPFGLGIAAADEVDLWFSVGTSFRGLSRGLSPERNRIGHDGYLRHAMCVVHG